MPDQVPEPKRIIIKWCINCNKTGEHRVGAKAILSILQRASHDFPRLGSIIQNLEASQ